MRHLMEKHARGKGVVFMADNEDLFKRTAFGGYDKDDVEQELQKLRDNAREEKTRLQKQLAEASRNVRDLEDELDEKNRKIQDLQDDLNAKDKEILEMERNIREKYQSYVDNYDTIGSLIYEAKIRAKQIDRETDAQKQKILADAQAEAQRIRDDAQADAQKTLGDVQRQIDERNREGKQQYLAVQEELGHVVEIFNQVQKQFMNSYRDIQKIVNEAPENEMNGIRSSLHLDEEE